MKIHEIIKEENLTEATFDIDQQVDYIWDKFFKEKSEAILGGKQLPTLTPEYMFSEDLPSSEIMDKANEIFPVQINIHDGNKGNQYIPQYNLITIDFNRNALEFVKKYGRLEYAAKDLEKHGRDSQAKSLMNEFGEARVKGSIHHELSHWLDDVFHNRHISNRLDKTRVLEPTARKKVMNQGQPDVALTNFERDAQVHSIKQLKRKYEDEWDSLSFEDMVRKNPSLEYIYDSGMSAGWGSKWKKMIQRRLHRENLLGKNMR
jgi:hypothetical protein